MSVSKYGIIMFMDALGTKSASESNWQRYINAWNSFNFDFDIISLSDGEFSMFSYTVIFALPSTNIAEDFTHLGKILLQLFLSGLKWGLFFRGTISVGNFYFIKEKSAMFAGIYYPEYWNPTEKKLLIGPAVNEAAKFYDKSKWIGISTMPSATKHLEDMKDNHPAKRYFINCNVKKYGACEDGWALAWPNFDDPDNPENINKEYHIKYLEENYDSFKDTDEYVANKYLHTMQFYKDVRKNLSDVS